MTHEALHSWLAAGAPGLRDHLVLSTLILVGLLAVSGSSHHSRPASRA